MSYNVSLLGKRPGPGGIYDSTDPSRPMFMGGGPGDMAGGLGKSPDPNAALSDPKKVLDQAQLMKAFEQIAKASKGSGGIMGGSKGGGANMGVGMGDGGASMMGTGGM